MWRSVCPHNEQAAESSRVKKSALEVAGDSNETANEQAADHSELTQTQDSDMENSHYEDTK